jgi:hypothetical protein
MSEIFSMVALAYRSLARSTVSRARQADSLICQSARRAEHSDATHERDPWSENLLASLRYWL